MDGANVNSEGYSYETVLDDQLKKANNDPVYYFKQGRTMHMVNDAIHRNDPARKKEVNENFKQIQDKHEESGVKAMDLVMQQGPLRQLIFQEHGDISPLEMNQFAYKMFVDRDKGQNPVPENQDLFQAMQKDACMQLLPDTELMRKTCFEPDDLLNGLDGDPDMMDFLKQCEEDHNLCDYVASKEDLRKMFCIFESEAKSNRKLRSIPDNFLENTEFTENDYFTIVEKITLYMAHGIQNIGSRAFFNFKYISSYEATWILPSTVRSIGDNCFEGFQGLHKLDLSNTQIDNINSECFKNSQFEIITLPEGIKKIDTKAFFGCRSLKYVLELENTQVTEIHNFAFKNCEELYSIKFPVTLQQIFHGSFIHCMNLREVDMANTSVTVIGKLAFFFCRGLKKVIFPETLEVLSYGAFENCTSLDSLNFHDTKEWVLRKSVFEDCTSLTVLQLPESIFVIANQAFAGTGLVEIVVPESVETIWDDAFIRMPNLKVVVFKNENNFRVRSEYAPDPDNPDHLIKFRACPALQKIIRRNKPITGQFVSKFDLKDHPDVLILSD